MFGGDPAEVRGDRVEGLVPPDLNPAGIGVALRPRPLQRTEEAFGVVDDLRRDLALEAQCLAGRMFGVGIEGCEPPVGDSGNRTAARDAQCAEAGDALAVVIGHGPAHSGPAGQPVKQAYQKRRRFTAGSLSPDLRAAAKGIFARPPRSARTSNIRGTSKPRLLAVAPRRRAAPSLGCS